MGKPIITQKRGKGSPTYKAPSFRYLGKPSHPIISDNTFKGVIENFSHCPGHTAPLAYVAYEDETPGLVLASEGMILGKQIQVGKDADLSSGNVKALGDIPEGTSVYNIEQVPGDGGKFVRSSGTFAKVVSKKANTVSVILPSKKTKEFNTNCRANIGVVAGGGRTEKPILKAGTMMKKMRARNKLYPKTSAASMNAVDHPFGNKHSSRKSKSRPISRNAPPGRKVGAVGARRTGKRKK